MYENKGKDVNEEQHKPDLQKHEHETHQTFKMSRWRRAQGLIRCNGVDKNFFRMRVINWGVKVVTCSDRMGGWACDKSTEYNKFVKKEHEGNKEAMRPLTTIINIDTRKTAVRVSVLQ